MSEPYEKVLTWARQAGIRVNTRHMESLWVVHRLLRAGRSLADAVSPEGVGEFTPEVEDAAADSLILHLIDGTITGRSKLRESDRFQDAAAQFFSTHPEPLALRRNGLSQYPPKARGIMRSVIRRTEEIVSPAR